MKTWMRESAMCAMAILALTSNAAEPLKNGDRVVFLGDSITQAGVGPNGYVTRFKVLLDASQPDLKVEILGAGISGNRVPDLEKRLERDVLSKKPTVVVIYIGINDVWHSQQGRGTPKDEFEAGLKRIIASIQKAGARIVLCTPSVIGEKTDGTNPLDKMLEEYSAVSRGIAQETNSQLLDLRRAFLDHLKQSNTENAEKNVLTTDGVHLNEAGNRFVAEQMLAAFQGSTTGARTLRHVVLFKFKADASPAQVQEVVDAFRKLPEKVEAVKGFEWGTDVSPEKLADGFTHCFFVTFADEKGRDTYLKHAAHQEFVGIAKPRLEKVLVVDYWTQK
jgi:lysophospholipase L1-like esterase